MRNIKLFFKEFKYNIAFYLFGFLLMGFSINIMKASNLGNGAWDTAFINMRYFFNNTLNVHWISVGIVSFIISTFLMIIVISYRKKMIYLLMVLPILLLALSIDFWNIIFFKDQLADQIIYQLIFYTLGLLLLPLGLTLIVKSSFPAIVFDELMLMFVKITKAKRITIIRLIIEALGLGIGVLFGYLTFYHVDGSFGSVNIGSFILTFTIGPIMSFYYKVLNIPKES